jgi:hypothetical protein
MSLTCTTEPMKATDTSEPMELDAAEGAAVLTIKGRNVDAAAVDDDDGAAAVAASAEPPSGTMHKTAICMHQSA